MLSSDRSRVDHLPSEGGACTFAKSSYSVGDAHADRVTALAALVHDRKTGTTLDSEGLVCRALLFMAPAT